MLSLAVGLPVASLGCSSGAPRSTGSADADVSDGGIEAGADNDGGLLDAGTDVADNGYSDACASCQTTLDQACTTDGGFDCPPNLDAPGLSDWAQRQIADHSGEGSWRAPLCYSYRACPEMVTIVFGIGVDCAQQFAFDAVTKKLVAISSFCNGVIGGCEGANGCIPNRCLSGNNGSGYGGETTSPACPLLPDAGLPDRDAQAE